MSPIEFIRRFLALNPQPDTADSPTQEEVAESVELKPSDETPSEDEIRLHAHLLAESDGFVETPETYWVCAEKALRYVKSYGSHTDAVRVVSLRLHRASIAHKR